MEFAIVLGKYDDFFQKIVDWFHWITNGYLFIQIHNRHDWIYFASHLSNVMIKQLTEAVDNEHDD